MWLNVVRQKYLHVSRAIFRFSVFFFFLMRQKSGSNVKSAVGFNLCAIINILVSNVLDREMETEIKHVKKQSAGYFGMLDRSF